MGIPNRARAVTTGRIATIKDGKRMVRNYQSGEKLVGEVYTPDDDRPPFTGYVRNWFRKETRHGKSQQPS